MKSMKNRVAAMMILSLTLSAFAQEDGPHRGHRGPRPQLTDTQRSCLESLIGKPGEGERPSYEEMDAAFTTCGIARPNKKPAPTSSDTSSSEAASNNDSLPPSQMGALYLASLMFIHGSIYT